MLIFLLQEAVLRLSKLFNLSQHAASGKGRKTVRHQRNICIVLGVLAEKLSGPSSVAMLTPGTLAYFVTNLVYIISIAWYIYIFFS